MPELKESVPAVPTALLDWLEKQFPNALPRQLPKPEEIARQIGQQDVLVHLRAAHKRQNST